MNDDPRVQQIVQMATCDLGKITQWNGILNHALDLREEVAFLLEDRKRLLDWIDKAMLVVEGGSELRTRFADRALVAEAIIEHLRATVPDAVERAEILHGIAQESEVATLKPDLEARHIHLGNLEIENVALKAQIADMRPRAISESEDRRCAVVCSYHPRYAVYKELGLEVRAALGAGVTDETREMK